jgi:hypothetical protein
MQEDGTLVMFDTLSDAVKAAVTQALVATPQWYNAIAKSHGKECVYEKQMALHQERATSIACKQCAYKHKFCIKKINDAVVLTPLCAFDRKAITPAPTFDDVAFFCLPETVRYAPSKTTELYQPVHHTKASSS